MMTEESLKKWEQDNIELLTSREMGEWLHRRDMNARPQGDLADEVWKLYEKYHSHLATHVIEFGDELKDLLGKHQKGEEDMRGEKK